MLAAIVKVEGSGMLPSVAIVSPTVSQTDTIGRNLEKIVIRRMNPATEAAVKDHSTHVG